MTAENQNDRLPVKSDYTFAYTVTDAADAAVDLTGATLLWRLRVNPFATANLIEVLDAAITVGGAGSNVASVPVTKAETALEPGEYFAELLSTDAAAKDNSLAQGWITFDPSVR